MSRSKRTNSHSDGFFRAIEQALEHFADLDWLGESSPLAAPYFLGSLLTSVASDTPQERGRALQSVLRSAAEGLTSEQQSFCRVAFFERDPNLNNFGVQRKLALPETTYYRHRNAIIQGVAEAVIKQVYSPIRPELIPQREMVGRTDPLGRGLRYLENGESVTIIGGSGAGKTTLAAAIAQGWDGTTHWYTIRPGLTDQLPSLLFSLGHHLHRLGAGHTWRQIIADKGQPSIAHMLGLLRADLMALRESPNQALLLCIDEVDQLHREREDHAQILYLLEALRDSAALLLVGQAMAIETTHCITLTGLPLPEIEVMLQRRAIYLADSELQQLARSTRGNPGLLSIAISMLRTGESLVTLLAQLSVAPSVELLLKRLWQRLDDVERELLRAVAVFRARAPSDLWPDSGATLAALQSRELIGVDARVGIEVLVHVREFVLRHTSADVLLPHHLFAAEALEVRGAFTEAAYHYIQARQPALATWLWFRHRFAEREHGQIQTAWQAFAQVSAADFDNDDDRRAFALLRAFQANELGLAEEMAQNIQSSTWPREHALTPYARQWQGKSQEMQGRASQALEAYRSGLDSIAGLLDARRTILHVLRGDIFLIHERELNAAKVEAIEAQFEAECFRGLVEEDLGNLSQAQNHYQLALNLAQQLDQDDDAKARILSHLGRLHYRLGHLDQSRQYSQQAVDTFRAHGSVMRILNEQMTLSMILIAVRRYQEAHQSALQGLQLAQDIHSPYFIAGHASNAGEVCYYLGQFDEAEHFALLSLHTEEAYIRPYALTVLGMAYLGRSQFDPSASHFRQAIDSAQALQDRFAEAPAWRWLGRVRQAQQDRHAMQRAYDNAVEIFTALGLLWEREVTLREQFAGGPTV